jgi:hypothetical protein
MADDSKQIEVKWSTKTRFIARGKIPLRSVKYPKETLDLLREQSKSEATGDIIGGRHELLANALKDPFLGRLPSGCDVSVDGPWLDVYCHVRGI